MVTAAIQSWRLSITVENADGLLSVRPGVADRLLSKQMAVRCYSLAWRSRYAA